MVYSHAVLFYRAYVLIINSYNYMTCELLLRFCYIILAIAATIFDPISKSCIFISELLGIEKRCSLFSQTGLRFLLSIIVPILRHYGLHFEHEFFNGILALPLLGADFTRKLVFSVNFTRESAFKFSLNFMRRLVLIVNYSYIILFYLL